MYNKEYTEHVTLINENERLVSKLLELENELFSKLLTIYDEYLNDTHHHVIDDLREKKVSYDKIIDEGFSELEVLRMNHPYSYSLQDAYLNIVDNFCEYISDENQPKDIVYITMDAFLFHFSHIATQNLIPYFYKDKKYRHSDEDYEGLFKIDVHMNEKRKVSFFFQHKELTNTVHRFLKEPHAIKKEDISREKECLLSTLLFGYELLERKEEINQLTKEMRYAREIKEVIASIVDTFHDFLRNVPKAIIKSSIV